MSDWFVRRGRVMNIAHRAGTEAYGPDVFDAVSHSGQAGADAIEIDIQATRDDQLVVYHDRLLNTPTGARELRMMTLADIRAAGPQGSPARLPLLAEIFDHVRTLPILLLLDLKAQDRVEPVRELVTRAGITARVAVASFHYRPLVTLVAQDDPIPAIATIGLGRAMRDPLGFCWSLYALGVPVRAARAIRARGLLCPAERVSARMVAAAHANDLTLFVWKVTPSTDLQKLLLWNVDGIVAADPTVVRAALEARAIQ
jgi:glycerophosphoryl diester phosphodiesterase